MQLKNDECEKGQQCEVWTEVRYVVGTSTFQKWMFVKGRFMGKSEPERKEQNGLKGFVVFWCIQRSEQPFNLVLGLSSSVFFMVQKQHSVYLTRLMVVTSNIINVFFCLLCTWINQCECYCVAIRVLFFFCSY